MTFLISTTGSTVDLNDLGISISHPTVDRNLLLEFSADELSNSATLTSGINSGVLSLKMTDPEYGLYTVDPDEYYPGFIVQNEYITTEFEEYISEEELAAGLLNQLIDPAATAISIVSIVSGTKTITLSSSALQQWKTAPGDKVVIIGSAAAGTYTVSSIIDQSSLVVVESIVSTGASGTLSIYHPVGSTRIAIDDSGLTNIAGSNLQDIVVSIDAAISGGPAPHQSLRQLIHFIDEGPAQGFTSGCYKVITGGTFPTSEIWYTPDNKKLVELLIVRNSNRTPYTETWNMYDTDGITVIETIIDTYAYNGVVETGRVRSIA